MARNVEVKARADDLALLRARLVEIKACETYELHQTDTFFHVSHGRLKLREFGDGKAELIFYDRADRRAARLSEYERIPCEQPEQLRRALASSLGVRGVVRKKREVALVDRTRVHFDEVEGLGSFLELEVVLGEEESLSAGERIADNLLRELRVPRSTLISRAYIDLMEELMMCANSGDRSLDEP